MCADKMALKILSTLKELKSLLYYFPTILILLVNFLTFDYSRSGENLSTSPENVICCASDITCYKAGRVDLGEANTIEGFRIENITIENRTKNPESESFKYLAAREGFQLQAKVFYHQNHNSQALCDVITVDRPVTFHKLII